MKSLKAAAVALAAAALLTATACEPTQDQERVCVIKTTACKDDGHLKPRPRTECAITVDKDGRGHLECYEVETRRKEKK